MEARSIAAPPDELRAHVRGMWAAVADGWGAHADWVDERGADVTAVLLASTRPQPGERVLELACGPGGVGLAAAPLVGPAGEVVLTDAVPEMTAIAAARAAALGLGNVATRELDLEQIDEPDDSFDVVVCREGLMFASDPGRAVGEIRRVLRPGGRVAVAVWGARERNPWLGLVFDAVSEQTGKPVPPPGVPGPFSLSEPGHVEALFAGASLRDARVSEVLTPLHAASFELWLERTWAVAGPLARLVGALPEAARVALGERLREAVAPYSVAAGLEIPGVSLIASARR